MTTAEQHRADWLPTAGMAEVLGMHPVSLLRLKLNGHFTENRHFRRLNPTMKRSHLRWHIQRTLERMRAV
jgi:hypothetical protein